MLDLSIWEIFVIVVACIIFIKPEDIPEILKQVGRLFSKIKKITHEFTSLLESDEESTIKPENKILGLDGKYHEAYDIKKVFPEELGNDRQ